MSRRLAEVFDALRPPRVRDAVDFLLLAFVATILMLVMTGRLQAQTVHRYLAMPMGWESPVTATEPPASGVLLEGLLARAAAQMTEFTDGRHTFVFDVAPVYRIAGVQPSGVCNLGWSGGDPIAAAAATGHGAGATSFLYIFPGIAAPCPSNTAWANWSGNLAWFEQISEDVVAHEIAGHEGVGDGGIREHAAMAICLSSPVGGFAFDVRTCHAHERGDPTTIMGVGQRFTLREYVNNGLRTADQRVTLGRDVGLRDVTIEKKEQIPGVQNLVVSGMDSNYNFTLITPVGVDALWARAPKVTVHGWVDGFDCYLYAMTAGDVFLNLRGGFSVEVLSIDAQRATLRTKYFEPTPDEAAPPTPTPGPWTPDPTPQPAECWAQFPYIRCSPTPTATVTPAQEPTWTPTLVPTETPTFVAVVTVAPSPTSGFSSATPSATIPPASVTARAFETPTPFAIGSPGCKSRKASIPGELVILAVALAMMGRKR